MGAKEGNADGAEDGTMVGRGVGLRGMYVGENVGKTVGEDDGALVGNGVGDPGI